MSALIKINFLDFLCNFFVIRKKRICILSRKHSKYKGNVCKYYMVQHHLHVLVMFVRRPMLPIKELIDIKKHKQIDTIDNFKYKNIYISVSTDISWTNSGKADHKKTETVESLLLNIKSAVHFITVTKSKMYWQGVKSIGFGVKRSVVKPYFTLRCNTCYFLQLQ